MPNRLTKKFIKQVFINVKAGDVDVVAHINNLTIRNQISLLKARDEFGWSILHWAIYENKDELVNALVEKYLSENLHIGIELRTGRGFFHGAETPLHIALRFCFWRSSGIRDDLVSLLLNNGADVNNSDQNGMTALHWAARNNCVAVINRILLNQNNYSILNQDTNGNNALHLAVRYTNCASIVALASFNRGALLTVKNHHDQTPLDLMKESNDENVKNLGNQLLQELTPHKYTLREVIINNHRLTLFNQVANRVTEEKRKDSQDNTVQVVKRTKR